MEEPEEPREIADTYKNFNVLAWSYAISEDTRGDLTRAAGELEIGQVPKAFYPGGP